MVILDHKMQKLIYLYLADDFKDRILSEEYPSCAKLPSIRELSRKFGVNPNTMQRVFNLLKREKLIEKCTTQSFIVTSDSQHILKVKRDTAKLLVSTFLKNMLRIGCSYKDICALVRKPQQQQKVDSKHDTITLISEHTKD